MDIKEIQEKKSTLEATIRDMIADFEDETGVSIQLNHNVGHVVIDERVTRFHHIVITAGI